MKLTITIIIVCILLTICIGQRIQIVTQQSVIYSYENTIDSLFALNLKLRKKIPTIEDIQFLVGAEVDGIIGPESLAKWDRAVCNQYAAEWNHYYEN